MDAVQQLVELDVPSNSRAARSRNIAFVAWSSEHLQVFPWRRIA